MGSAALLMKREDSCTFNISTVQYFQWTRFVLLLRYFSLTCPAALTVSKTFFLSDMLISEPVDLDQNYFKLISIIRLIFFSPISM
jgi:hypothetical protein